MTDPWAVLYRVLHEADLESRRTSLLIGQAPKEPGLADMVQDDYGCHWCNGYVGHYADCAWVEAIHALQVREATPVPVGEAS